MDADRILALVLDALRLTNQTRLAEAQLEVSPTAPIFGPASPLDSLGLVGLLIDLEEACEQAGYVVVLSDERALSETRSPFRDVPSLAAYIARLTAGE